MLLRLLFVGLAFLSGAVALSHELLWTRRLIDLLGATEAVTGRVLGLFFLGLSLGGWLATRWSHTGGNPAIRLAIAEISIAVLSLPAIFLPLWADGLVAGMGTELLISWQGNVVKAVLAMAVVLPPAIAMGTTMPMFIQVIAQLGGAIRRSGIWIYSLNMLGGVFGLWLVSTCLLEMTGVRGAMFCAAFGNVLIGIVSLGFASRVGNTNTASVDQSSEPSQEGQNQNAATAPFKVGKFKHVFVMAFLSGAVVLAIEVLILRLLALVAPSSLQTTSALLANVILFLALGSVAVAFLNSIKLSSQNQLIIGAMGASLFCFLCPLILYARTDQLISVRYLASLNGLTIDSIGHYWFLLFGLVAASSGAAMFFFGLVFPSILSIHSKHDPRGRSIGLLLATNGLGGLLGAELGNWFLLSQIGIYKGFAILAVATAIVVVLICFFANRKFVAVGIAFGMFFVAILTPKIQREIKRANAPLGISSVEVNDTIDFFNSYQDLRYLSPRAMNSREIKKTYFGRDGVLMVTEVKSGARSLLMNNQYVLGSSGPKAEATERRQLMLPWILHPESEKVCCLGFATGISSSGLEMLDAPPQITSVELSEKVVEIAREHFSDQHQTFFRRPGNRVVREDARTFMTCAEDQYDLIVADLFRPHGAGESRLFSVEHFRNVKRALRSDGMFCQWLPAHQLNLQQFEMIANTFRTVFPNTLVVAGGESMGTPAIGLCAWKSDRPWETPELVRKIEGIRKEKGISDILSLNAQLLVVGVLDGDSLSDVPVNTLDNALLEIDAGKFWITKDLRADRPPDDLENGFLKGDNWRKFMVQLYKDTEPVMDPVHRKQYLNRLKK